jgi:endonuclease-8
MPEGPSIVIAAEELAPFAGREIFQVTGNSKQPIQRMAGLMLHDVFSFGKYLNFQFDDFALKIHFMLFGSFRVGEPRPGRDPRLTLSIVESSGEVSTAYFYSCSVRFVEEPDLKATYDYRTDIMAPQWNRAYALRQIKALPPDSTVDDVLMNQRIFTGLGNIMKNETLWRRRLAPLHRLGDLTPRELGKLVTEAREYAFQFYAWKKAYVLRKNYQIYRQGKCPRGCEAKVIHRKTGKGERMSHWCPVCQV